MSVVGFDFGNERCIVAVVGHRGIDVVLNDESKRETPAIVCFGDKQRFIGTAGAAATMMNPKNSVSQIKRLIGRQFSDPKLQQDLKSLPFTVTEGPGGYPLIHAQYLGEVKTFTPTQILGMVLSDLKVIAEKNLNKAVVDCCIGIPVYFTDLQRRAVLDAAAIAGLHPLCLIHETTATALAYSIFQSQTDLSETEQVNVAFVDIGHGSMQVCIARFKKGQLKILSHSSERSLGGRDFDEVIFQHFVAKFREEYKIEVLSNAKACLRLRASCEKAKKVLSANAEALINIESLIDEKDVRGLIKRGEFEQICAPILERVKRPLEKALAEAGLTVENVHTVEVVGSGSRVPAVMRILSEFFGKELRGTMNASECVARGAALQCAILSPTFMVREFQVNECFPAAIALSWKVAFPELAENQQSTIVFPKGNPIPSLKALTFHRSGTFSVDVHYADAHELQAPAMISTYTIGPFQSTKCEREKLKVKARLNLHGIVSIELATLLEEEEIEAPSTTSQKKVKKTKIPVAELVYGGMSPLDLRKAVEKEFEMALQDRVMEETKDKKKAVESYVYDMRNKLNDKYHDFVIESEKDRLMATLQEVEDWLYEDGEDETKGVYHAKLEELKEQGDPIEERYKEFTERRPLIEQLFHCINSHGEAAESTTSQADVHMQGMVKQTNIPVVEVVYGGMSHLDLQKAVKEEFEMALQDRVMEDTKDKKKAVESYVYDMRNKLNDKYHDFVVDSEKDRLLATLKEAEDWLYKDGDDETKSVYIYKLEELKKQGDPIEERYKEFNERRPLIEQLFHCINSYGEAVESNDTMFDHIGRVEKRKVLNQCVEAQAWLREKKRQQDALPKYANPVLLSADLRKKAEEVDRVCRPIMTKPKPVVTQQNSWSAWKW